MPILTKKELWDSDQRYITNDEGEFDRNRGSSKDEGDNRWRIFISDPEPIKNLENASYDVTVGRLAIKLNEFTEDFDIPIFKNEKEMDNEIPKLTRDFRYIDPTKKEVEIYPREVVIIYTNEKIGLPLVVTGLVNTDLLHFQT